MSNSWPAIRRRIATEMDLWGGALDATLTPGKFSSVDVNGSLFIVYDVNRPEPDNDWNGSYICINPGGTGNSALTTVWRRIADNGGFISATGAMSLTSALPSSAYAATTMTYELYKQFKPEQWMNAANFASREAYPQRHRLLAFEVPEDPNTVYYDWGHLSALLTMADPTTGPVINVIPDPGGATNTWNPGSYSFAYNIWNAAGETLVSSVTTSVLSAGQIIEFANITVPEQAVGIRYWCTEDPGGTVLSELSIGAGILSSGAAIDNVQPQPGYANPSNFVVPAIRFWGPPSRSSRTTPAYNTTGLDNASMSLKTIKRRVNPGQYPERYVDLNSDGWRSAGGTVAKIEFRPLGQYMLRFECIAPIRPLLAENDTSDEPMELLIAGAMVYMWNQLLMTGSAQNVQAWQAEVKLAEARYTKARNYYAMERPRSTIRRPRITIGRWYGTDY